MIKLIKAVVELLTIDYYKEASIIQINIACNKFKIQMSRKILELNQEFLELLEGDN